MSTDHETESDPTWEDVVSAYARRIVQERDGPMLAEVISYDQGAQTAVVRPLIAIWRGDRFAKIPPITVYVSWPQAGAFSITFPIAAGTIVQLIPLEADHAQYLASGNRDGTPRSKRRAAAGHSVAIPLAPRRTDGIPADALAVDGMVIAASPFLYLGGVAGADFVVAAAKMVTVFNTHTHPTPAGASSAPTTPITSSQIAATRVKAV